MVQPFTVFTLADWKIVCLLHGAASFRMGARSRPSCPAARPAPTSPIRSDPTRCGPTACRSPPTTSNSPMSSAATRIARSPMPSSIARSSASMLRTTRPSRCIGTASATITRRSTISSCCRRIWSARPSPTRRSTGCAPCTRPIRPIPDFTIRSLPGQRIRLGPPYRAGAQPALSRGPRPISSGSSCARSRTPPQLGANLLSGTIDMVAGEVGLPIDEALAFEKLPMPASSTSSTSRVSPSSIGRLQSRRAGARRSPGARGAARRARSRDR